MRTEDTIKILVTGPDVPSGERGHWTASTSYAGWIVVSGAGETRREAVAAALARLAQALGSRP